MALLRAVEPARVSASFRLGWPSAREVASMPEESYDKASPSRGRKSRLRADCCNTTAPQAIGAPQDLLQLLRTPLQNARGRFALLTGAGWQSPRIAAKMALPTFHRVGCRCPWISLPWPAAGSLRPSRE